MRRSKMIERGSWRATAWFSITIGLTISVLWTSLLAGGQVPEVERGEIAIWFHIGAEWLTAGLLILGGVGMLGRRWWAGRVSAVAFGALLYTTVASPGYYADAGEWPVVVVFGVLAVATGLVAWRSVRAARDEERSGARVP